MMKYQEIRDLRAQNAPAVAASAQGTGSNKRSPLSVMHDGGISSPIGRNNFTSFIEVAHGLSVQFTANSRKKRVVDLFDDIEALIFLDKDNTTLFSP